MDTLKRAARALPALVFVTHAAAGGADFGLLGFDATAGWANSDFGSGGGGAISVAFLEVTEGLFVQGTAIYSRTSEQETFDDFVVENELEQFTVAPELRFYFRRERAGLYVSGGPAFVDGTESFELADCLSDFGLCLGAADTRSSETSMTATVALGYLFGSSEDLRFGLEGRHISSSGGTTLLSAGLAW